jgi:hypothetical protein
MFRCCLSAPKFPLNPLLLLLLLALSSAFQDYTCSEPGSDLFKIFKSMRVEGQGPLNQTKAKGERREQGRGGCWHEVNWIADAFVVQDVVGAATSRPNAYP